MAQETREVIGRWHDMMSASAHEGLFELLAEDCIFGPRLYTHPSEVETSPTCI